MQAEAIQKKKTEECERKALARVRREKKKEKREKEQEEAKERALLKEQEDFRMEFYRYGNRSVGQWVGRHIGRSVSQSFDITAGLYSGRSIWWLVDFAVGQYSDLVEMVVGRSSRRSI